MEEDRINRTFTPRDVDVIRLQKDFWDNINNPQKISSNILSNKDVTPVVVDGNQILKITVPRAAREDKPIYIGNNPFQGTYRRDFEGNYRCSDTEVRRMLSERTSEAQDYYILPNYSLDDLNKPSYQSYRKRFSVGKPDSDWNDLDDIEFLTRVGAWRKDRATQMEGLTVAGLLMFGVEEAITSQFPHYFLDYREKLSDVPGERWSNRITSQDGSWSGNLYDFYYKVITNITSDIAVPFVIEGADYARQSDTRVHKALREAVLNTLIHANYSGEVGIVMVKEKRLFTFSNPGVLRLPIEKAIAGGNSDPRNPNIFKMFFQIGLGERSGYGLESIHTTWKQQHWVKPNIVEEVRPEQTTLTLSTTSLLPPTVVSFLSDILKEQFKELTSDEVLLLATAVQEGSVSNTRMQQLTDMHSQDILKFLTKLVSKDLLVQEGYGRGTKYVLSDLFDGKEQFFDSSGQYEKQVDNLKNNYDEEHPVNDEVEEANDEVEEANDEVELSNDEDRAFNDEASTLNEKDEQLLLIAERARTMKRIDSNEMKQIILKLCTGRYLSSREIASLMKRKQGGITRYLRELVNEEKLQLKYPTSLNSKNQAYTTKR